MPDVSSWTPRCEHPLGLVAPVAVDPAGAIGPTRGQARSRRWRRTHRGYYVAADADPTLPEQRILEASVLLPPGGAVTGWAACRWRGAGYFDGVCPDGRTPQPVPLSIGPSRYVRPRPGVAISRDRLDPGDVETFRGVACVTAARALFDDMRASNDIREAVVAMDMMAAAELTSIQRMRRYCARRRGWNGVPQVRAALDLACEDSLSPAESRMRLVWLLDAALPPPLVNQPVFDRGGRLLGVADLLDAEAGVVGEYDGAAHRGRQRHRRDVRREDLFRRAGLEYFKVVGGDLRDVDLVVDRMLSTRARARFEPPATRDWTLTPPPGWYDSPLDGACLDERLAYREWQDASYADVAPAPGS